MTALIVARPALRGESLGLVSDLSDPGGLIWTSFVLLGCGAWACWRLWSGREDVFIGRVEAALLVGVALMFFGVGFTAYRRAALLGCWEWVGLLLVLFLTRQLATTEREKHGLYAVLLATGVALSVQGIYQAGWELPRDRVNALEYKEGPRDWVGRQFGYTFESVSDGERELLTQRLLRANAHATFLYPSSLAAVLALILPGLVAVAVVAVRGDAEVWQYSLAITCALAATLALVATGSLFAILATLFACFVLIGRGRILAWFGGLVLVGLVAMILYASGAMDYTLMLRGEAWRATWKMIHAGNFWTGVGPGHFGFYYPLHMRESDGAPAIDANSAVLDLWAAGGLFLVVLFAFAALFLALAVWRWWRVATVAERDEATTPGTELPWEFYVGGMLGVLYAFVLRTSSLAETDIISLAVLAALGALAWFAAYALFEQVVWTPGERVMALGCGIGAMGLTLLFGSGVDRPAVMALLFVAIALLLAHVEPVPSPMLSRKGLAMNLPVPVFLAGSFAFFLLVVVPTANTASVTRKARIAAFIYRSQFLVDNDKRSTRDPVAYLRANVLEPLRMADQEEHNVVRTNALLGRWYAEDWAMTWLDPSSDIRQRLAIEYAGRARTLCSLPAGEGKIRPVGTEGLYAEFTVRQLFTQRMLAMATQLEKEAKAAKQPAQKAEIQKMADGRREQARGAARDSATVPLEALRQQDPTNPQLAFLLAQTWDAAGDKKKRDSEAGEALRLDAAVGESRKLTSTQRGQLEAWETEEKPK